jgi:protein-L-isoaspartate(D-aspartate) O-methyltransferase
VLAYLAATSGPSSATPPLAPRRYNLAAAGVHNVTLVVGDGTRGLPGSAPYDAINVAAAGSSEPRRARGTARDSAGASSPGDRAAAAPVAHAPHARAGLERELLEEVRFVPLVRDD